MPGDVVFIGGTNDWANIGARLSDHDKRYGHVGIVVQAQQGLAIIHASGAPGTGGVVTQTPYSEFIKKAKLVGVYRPEHSADMVIALAKKGANDALPFDDDFSLDTADSVYCTEFIWRVLSTTFDQDAIPEKSDLYGTPIITLEDVQHSPHLRAIQHIEKKADK